MKLTLKQLKRIIKEELNKTMNESAWQDGWDAGKAGDDYDDSAYPDKKAKANYDDGYSEGQELAGGDLQGFVGSDPEPSQTSQAFARHPKKGKGKHGEHQMAWKAVLAYNNEQLEYNPNWHPVPGFVDKVAESIASYFENKNRPPDETELNGILDRHDAE
jgi:hypothetical protein